MAGVPAYYKGKGIFVTGATGFLGKVLLSKLLRSCPSLEVIYVLIRSKRGSNPADRLSQLLETRIFNDLSDEAKGKVCLIEGDVTQPGLGIPPEQLERLLLRVNVIFHSAATVKFDEDLTVSVRMNVLGTLSALEIASKVKNLLAFVHVSTAYCNPQARELEERIYDKDMPYSPKEIIALVEEKGDYLNDKAVTKEVLSGWPNTYTFTKAIAEKAILEYSHVVPVAIMRPSIVVASLKEPLPGWIDNLNGPSGILVGHSTGILQSMCIDVDCIGDLIPVDICINLLCVIPPFLSKRPGINNNNDDMTSPVPVFNCNTGTLNPIQWKTIEKYCHIYCLKYPTLTRFWYITGSFKSSKTVDNICQVLFHHAPSILGDWIRRLLGYKPFLRTLINRMTGAFPALEYFACKSWNFSNTQLLRLYDGLSEEDQSDFGFDARKIQWEDYFKNYVLGARRFLVKEDPSSIEEARKKLARFYYLHVSLKALLWFLVFNFFAYFALVLYEGVF